MNTLQELNNYGRLTVDVIDLNPSGVVFDRGGVNPGPSNYLFSADAINGSFVVVPEPGINILEVRNYQTANVRYRVRIVGNPTVTGSNVSWGVLPEGVELAVSGNTYTLTGINNKSQWDAVKYFTWSIPSNYSTYNAFYLDVAVIYYDSAQEEDIITDWEVYDPNYYEIASLTSAATLVAVNRRIKTFTSSLSSTFSGSFEIRNLKQFGSSMSSAFNVVASAVDARLFSTSTASASGNRIKFGVINVTSAGSFSVNLNVLVDNMVLSRNYQSNIENRIFASNTPQIGDGNSSTTSTFTIEFAVSNGLLSFNSGTPATSTLTYSGTLAQVNSQFSSLRYYPNKNYSGTDTLTYTQKKDGITQLTRTVSLLNTGTGSITTQTYTFGSNSVFTPSNEQALYGFADLLVVGAGGGGATGGGGGGEVIYQTDLPITVQSYSVVVGDGGVAGDPVTSGEIIQTGSNPTISGQTSKAYPGWTHHGGNGANSSALGYTAIGGKGGKSYWSGNVYMDPTQGNNIVPVDFNFNGGDNGGTPSYFGGTGQTKVYAGQNTFLGKGGGGAGDAANGANSVWSGTSWSAGSGGAGTSNTITGSTITYGVGGAGGNLQSSTPLSPTSNSGNGGAGATNLVNLGVRGAAGAKGRVIIKVHA